MVKRGVKVNVNFRAVVWDHLVSVHVRSAAFGEDPSVVDFVAGVCNVGNVGLALDDDVFVVDFDVAHFAVGGNCVLVDDLVLEHVLPAPVDFVYVVAVG